MAIISHEELVRHLRYILNKSKSDSIKRNEQEHGCKFPELELGSLDDCAASIARIRLWESFSGMNLDFRGTLERVVRCYELTDDDFRLAWMETVMREIHAG